MNKNSFFDFIIDPNGFLFTMKKIVLYRFFFNYNPNVIFWFNILRHLLWLGQMEIVAIAFDPFFITKFYRVFHSLKGISERCL